MKSSLFLLCALLTAAMIGTCSAESTKLYRCPKVSTAPVIDGVLDDDAWTHAPVVTFVDTFTGTPAQRITVARLCWDDHNLYVSYYCSGSDVWGTVLEHDGMIFLQEVVEIFADTDCDEKSYAEIDVSPRNVTFDGMFDPDRGAPLGSQAAARWTCRGLRTAVHVDGTLDDRTDVDRGWSAEMAIPFASIGAATPKLGQEWRINLYRVTTRPKPTEYQAWSPTYTRGSAFHVPTRFGTLVFAGDKDRVAKTADKNAKGSVH